LPWIPELTALAQVLLFDVVLAGDNAVVVGLAVAGLPRQQKTTAIAFGMAAATLIRVICAAITFRLLEILGLTLAGGLLLLWVCWRMYRELRKHPPGLPDDGVPRKTLAQAMLQIVLADLSMSLDNVLAVAGAAEGHFRILVAGLAISVALTGIAAGILARLLERHRWLAWIGVLIVLYVALKMIWEGSHQVAHAV
jgi:YjbE family integral membrane protein